MHIRIEPSSGVPITRQVIDQIRTLCAAGTLLPGDRLPSVRQLAGQLAVNQNTILRVYERLTAEGFLERRHGDGTFVADFAPKKHLRKQLAALEEETFRLARHAQSLGVSLEDLTELLTDAMKQERGMGIPTHARQADPPPRSTSHGAK